MKKLRVKPALKIPFCHTIPLDILDELAARFLINMPLEEREDLVRVCFQVELAHWFFIDFYLPKNKTLVECSIKEFAAHIFHHVPFLQEYSDDVDQVVDMWKSYKQSVPVNGAIILNTSLDKVLMVQGFSKKAGWAFPKGKINEGEEAHDCAAREVLEETGFDVGELVQEDVYFEQVVNNQTVRLYVVAGVSENTEFYPRSRGEISNIQWWDLASLPTRVGDKTTKDKLGLTAHMFYNVIPFIRSIKRWVAGEIRKNPNSFHVLSDGGENYSVGNRRDVESRGNYNNYQKLAAPVTNCSSFYPISWQNFKLDLAQIEQQMQETSSAKLFSNLYNNSQNGKDQTRNSSWQDFISQFNNQSRKSL